MQINVFISSAGDGLEMLQGITRMALDRTLLTPPALEVTPTGEERSLCMHTCIQRVSVQMLAVNRKTLKQPAKEGGDLQQIL